MKARQEFRQHSKSTLLRAAQTLMVERAAIVQVEGRKWKRRLAWAVGGAFLVGSAVGLAAARYLGA